MAEIRHKLSFAVMLIDTTSGRGIDEKNVQFYKNDEEFKMGGKNNGVYLAINIEPVNFNLRINIQGYEEKELYVDFDELNEKMPLVELYMIPKDAVSLKGRLKGITELQAASEDESSVFLSGYDEKKKVVRLFNPHSVKLMESQYAVIHRDKGDFEIFKPVKEGGMDTVPVKDSLKEPFKVNDPISRLVHGDVGKDGSYLLKVRDLKTEKNFIVRFVVNGKTYFQRVDFNDPGELKLTEDKPDENPPESEGQTIT